MIPAARRLSVRHRLGGAGATPPIGLGPPLVTEAELFPFRSVRKSATGNALVTREPVGVVAAVVPWNVPLIVVSAKAHTCPCSPAAPWYSSQRPKPR